MPKNAEIENLDYIEHTYNDKRKRDQSSAKCKKEKKEDKTMKQFNNTNTRWAGRRVCTCIYRCSSRAGSSTWKDLRYARPSQAVARMQMIQDYRH